MDLKSGFLNIRVHPDTVGLLGLVCHEGLFVWKRMAFGLLGAPMWFQYVVDQVLGRSPNLTAVAYIDDITAHGTHWEQVWEDTLEVLRVLTQAGFMVNLRKCKFLRPRVTILGCSFFDAGY
jgi:hypothetical protein